MFMADDGLEFENSLNRVFHLGSSELDTPMAFASDLDLLS